MNTNKFFLCLSIFFLISSIAHSAENKGSLVIIYENLESNTGTVVVKLYDSNSPKFPDTKSAISIKTVQLENLQTSVVFENLPFGTYAFSTFHDENENGKMDTNFIHFPTEGYAFSNNLKITMGPPSFEKASFKINEATKRITVKLNY
ncbi:MAG: DUF2141 domain-containing protein [Prolixibacteraceae bacterium]|jgi:uncharacterized protein (DUF2141 family)|nr:DUF2141 domain-containing protein [Prolixibacteraceae bacterium]